MTMTARNSYFTSSASMSANMAGSSFAALSFVVASVLLTVAFICVSVIISLISLLVIISLLVLLLCEKKNRLIDMQNSMN